MMPLDFRPLLILDNGRSLPITGSLQTQALEHGTRYDFEITNSTGKTLRAARVRLFEMNLKTTRLAVFRQGFHMPSDSTGFHELRSGQPPPNPNAWRQSWCGTHDFASHSMIMLKLPARSKMVLAGFASFQRYEGVFVCNTQGKHLSFSAWCDLEKTTLLPGASYRLESLIMFENDDFNHMLGFYAGYVGKQHNARIPRATITGWVDWQYYREEKNERDILKSVSVLKQLRQRGYPLRYIIVDGGWCKYASEWLEPCNKFPDMPRFARRIRRAGFELGLWLAPYITNVQTIVARQHPEWMVLDEKTGRPLVRPSSNVGPCNVLDFTVPDALEWLRQIVRVMVREWKIGYLKLDGPATSHYRGGRFHNPGMTIIEQIRASLRVIRAECGEHVIVEGEGIYGPAIGYVDIQRTTQDTHPCWHNLESGRPLLKENMKNDLLSAFMHRRFWHVHRENVILRDFPSPFHAGKARDPNAKEAVMTDNQLRFQLSACALAGGAMLLTDPMTELRRNSKRMELIGRFLPHFEGQPPAQALDVFQDAKNPSIYHLAIERPFENWHVVGVFNWDDLYADFNVPIRKITGGGAWRIFDFWNEAYLGVAMDKITIRDVPAQGCRIFAVRRRLNHPQLIGSNLHILQGAVELKHMEYCAAKKILRLTIEHCDQRERRVFIWRPAACGGVQVRSNAKDWLLDDRRPHLLVLQFNGSRRTDFEVIFR